MLKKKNIKSRLIDSAIILLCMAGSFIFIRAFWLEYNRTFTKLNETPVGTITFKKRTAQRKIIDRVSWDLLKQSSGIYNGDTIRTVSASEAVISFRDETTKVALNANTLVQIFYNDTEGARINFSEGSIEVNSGTVKSVAVTQGSKDIVVQGQASLNKNDEGFSLFVPEGSAVLDGEIIETGGLIIHDEQGERNNKPAIIVTSLGSSSRIKGMHGEGTPVFFEWQEYNFIPGTLVIIETSLDPYFKNITHTEIAASATSVSILLDSGEYFWRAYPADALKREPATPMYPSGILEIISDKETALALTTPSFEPETESADSVVTDADVTAHAAHTANAQTALAVPANTAMPALTVQQVFFDKNRWEPYTQAQSELIRNRVRLDYQTGKEHIQGQEKDVLAITVALPGTDEWRQGLIDITDDVIIQKLKTAEGLRFKVIGDTGQGWQILVQTSSVRDYGFHEYILPIKSGQIIEVNIPFSVLRQPVWATQIRFESNNITVLQIRRFAAQNQYYSGSSTIKIFDFEIY